MKKGHLVLKSNHYRLNNVRWKRRSFLNVGFCVHSQSDVSEDISVVVLWQGKDKGKDLKEIEIKERQILLKSLLLKACP